MCLLFRLFCLTMLELRGVGLFCVLSCVSVEKQSRKELSVNTCGCVSLFFETVLHTPSMHPSAFNPTPFAQHSMLYHAPCAAQAHTPHFFKTCVGFPSVSWALSTSLSQCASRRQPHTRTSSYSHSDTCDKTHAHEHTCADTLTHAYAHAHAHLQIQIQMQMQMQMQLQMQMQMQIQIQKQIQIQRACFEPVLMVQAASRFSALRSFLNSCHLPLLVKAIGALPPSERLSLRSKVFRWFATLATRPMRLRNTHAHTSADTHTCM